MSHLKKAASGHLLKNAAGHLVKTCESDPCGPCDHAIPSPMHVLLANLVGVFAQFNGDNALSRREDQTCWWGDLYLSYPYIFLRKDADRWRVFIGVSGFRWAYWNGPATGNCPAGSYISPSCWEQGSEECDAIGNATCSVSES